VTKVGIYDAKTRFAELVKMVKRGESIIITSRGKPVAELVAPRERQTSELSALISSIKANRVGKINRKLFSELKLDGRRN
jgi:prevent-host-death family protein